MARFQGLSELTTLLFLERRTGGLIDRIYPLMYCIDDGEIFSGEGLIEESP